MFPRVLTGLRFQHPKGPSAAGAGYRWLSERGVPSLKDQWVETHLPAYAPELNPVEYIWGYCKQHELPNLCPKNFGQLSWAAKDALRRMRRRPGLVTSFWKQVELF